MRLEPWEKETIIRTSEEKGDCWHLWTISPAWAKKLTKLGYRLEQHHQSGWSVDLPMDKLTVRPFVTKKRKLTPEQVEANKARLAQAEGEHR